jgi:leader peptidase (prepilin peptidase) / N-methyltransferase
VNGPALVALCLAAGAAVGLAWHPLVPTFGRRSEEALEQPRWTVVATSPWLLACAGGLVFAAAAARFGDQRSLVPGLLLCALLVGITAVDLRFRIIPNRLVAVGVVAGFGLTLAISPGRWLELLLGASLATVFLFAAAVVSPGGLGMGDVKLAGMLGAFLGSAVAVALAAGLFAAALPSVFLLARGGRSARGMTLALGPFLALGGVVALLFGHQVLHWYMHH